MSNMSYCRFQNTLSDLVDCADNINDIEEMSEEELKARKQLIRLCMEIAYEFSSEFDNEEEGGE